MREYEFTVITRSDLPDGERAKVLDRYEALMFKDSGELLKRDDWGIKKLSYPVKKKHRGHYMHYDFVGAKVEGLREAERLLRIDENVLRYMLIRTNDNVDVEKRKTELAKQAQPRQISDNI